VLSLQKLEVPSKTVPVDDPAFSCSSCVAASC
jgi:hypothetical protein